MGQDGILGIHPVAISGYREYCWSRMGLALSLYRLTISTSSWLYWERVSQPSSVYFFFLICSIYFLLISLISSVGIVSIVIMGTVGIVIMGIVSIVMIMSYRSTDHLFALEKLAKVFALSLESSSLNNSISSVCCLALSNSFRFMAIC